MDFKDYLIVIIGAGKVAYSLTVALSAAGFKPGLIISRNLISAKSLSKLCKIKSCSDNISDLPNKPIAVFIAVPDSELMKVSSSISKLKIDFRNSLFIHLSGSQNLTSLKSISAKGGNTGSFHFMQSFPSKKIHKIAGSYVGIEYKNKVVKDYLLHISNSLGLNSVEIPKGGKTAYHLTGVFISNFLVSNFFIAEKIFSDAKIKEIDLVAMLEPILKATIQNIKNSGVINAISGPIERGDVETIKTHIETLLNQQGGQSGFPLLLISYLIQSLTVIKLIEIKNGRISENQEQINNLLKEEIKKHFSFE